MDILTTKGQEGKIGREGKVGKGRKGKRREDGWTESEVDLRHSLNEILK
jgi:hypothetical protein